MGPKKVASDFDQIIQADRERRKNEELAKEIFGRGKKKEDVKKDNKRIPRAPTLASRMGIQKRSASTSSLPSPRNIPRQPARKPPTAVQTARADRITTELSNAQSTNILPTSQAPGPGLSIKGTAGPFVVGIRNLAPGTTEADIESAFQNDAIDHTGVNSLVSCRITQTRPTVASEIVFTEKSIAEAIINKYNNQKADGRILHLKLVRSGPGSMSKHHQQSAQLETTTPALVTSQSEKLDIVDTDIAIDDDVDQMEDIDMAVEPQPTAAVSETYMDEREAADRDRRDRESRPLNHEGDFDGRNGHNNSNRRRGNDDRRRDDRDRDRDRDRERDGERDRTRDRDRDRDRERERDRDRDYERRDAPSRPQLQSQPSLPSQSQEDRNIRPSHYGNGVGGGQRSYSGGFGGGGGGYRGQYAGGGGRGGPGNYNSGSGSRGLYRGNAGDGGWRGGQQQQQSGYR